VVISDHTPIVVVCKFLSACSNVADPALPPVATAVKQVVTSHTTLLSTRRGWPLAQNTGLRSQCTDHTPASDPPLIAQRMVTLRRAKWIRSRSWQRSPCQTIRRPSGTSKPFNPMLSFLLSLMSLMVSSRVAAHRARRSSAWTRSTRRSRRAGPCRRCGATTERCTFVFFGGLVVVVVKCLC
jgi:hypothetical protein